MLVAEDPGIDLGLVVDLELEFRVERFDFEAGPEVGANGGGARPPGRRQGRGEATLSRAPAKPSRVALLRGACAAGFPSAGGGASISFALSFAFSRSISWSWLAWLFVNWLTCARSNCSSRSSSSLDATARSAATGAGGGRDGVGNVWARAVEVQPAASQPRTSACRTHVHPGEFTFIGFPSQQGKGESRDPVEIQWWSTRRVPLLNVFFSVHFLMARRIPERGPARWAAGSRGGRQLGAGPHPSEGEWAPQRR